MVINLARNLPRHQEYVNNTYTNVRRFYRWALFFDYRYWYEMQLRPVSVGCQPKGFVEVIEDEGRRGIIASQRELTAEQLDEYDMKTWTFPLR